MRAINLKNKTVDGGKLEQFGFVKTADGYHSVGAYVGAIREEYEKVLAAFVESCCSENIFRAEIVKNLVEYVREKYGDELEFLWAKFPKNAIWRRRDTQKWYAVILGVNEKKLGLNSDNEIEVIDLRGEPEEIKNLVDDVNYFVGYHMNKKSWFTIRLDGSVALEKICEHVDKSYTLAIK